MVHESLYLTTHEAALAVVATALKKARQLFSTLAINALLGGILFSSGGMLYVMLLAELGGIYATNPGVISVLQALVYPIGLFYVVTMGVDLFNSNILYFTVGVVRGAVSVTDVLVSLVVSWWLNLVGNIFVCYVMCHYSGVSSTPSMVAASVLIVQNKMQLSFVQTLIKAMAGNFFVCLAMYLQLMAKPLHVKLIVMALPIFTFVCVGFTHSVADMYMIIMGLINGAPHSVGACSWKLFLPSALGNIIGGAVFSLVVPWYLHLVVVERDKKQLHLPNYEMRDEQPELNQDSRVVHLPAAEGQFENIIEVTDDEIEKWPPANAELPNLARLPTRASSRSAPTSTRTAMRKRKSPKNVFPVLGMGESGPHERAVAYGEDGPVEEDAESNDGANSATLIGERLWRSFTRNPLNTDLEGRLAR